jgi:RNA polymerase sigma-70 factor (ECF subfamily)
MIEKAMRAREALLVLRAQAGDQEALSELLKAVQELLYRYIIAVVRDRHLAEDILQEVFIRIYRKLGWLREPGVFRAWAYQIATRETFRYLKRERRWTDQTRDEAALKTIPAPPPREAFANEMIGQIPQLIDNLSPASRAVIALYYLHEMSLDETAAVLSIPIGTVKSRLAYGLQCLRRQLQNQGEAPKGRSQ